MNIPVKFDYNDRNFKKQPAGNGRATLTEKVRNGHFWPVYAALCGLLFLALAVFIIWGLVSGNIRDGADKDVPPMAFLLLLSLGFGALGTGVALAHFRHHFRKVHYAPAVLNLPDPLHAGSPARLSFSKNLLRPGPDDDTPGEVRAQLQLLVAYREAPRRDGEDMKDAQGKYSVGVEQVWQEQLRAVPVSPNGGFAAEWQVALPELAHLNIKPNAMYAYLLMTVEMRRKNRNFLEPLRIILPPGVTVGRPSVGQR